MNHRFNRHSSRGLFSKLRHPSPASPRWKNLGSCEVCEWTIHLAIGPEVIGRDHLNSLAEELVEDRVIDRDDLFNLLEFSGIETVEEFARF